MKKYRKFPLSAVCFIFLFLCCTACVNTKKVAYFNSISDTSLNDLDGNLDPVIQRGDLLSISVSSITPEVAVVFNTPNTSAVSSLQQVNSAQTAGYLVDQDGHIQFPLLGNIRAAGTSKKVLKDEIENALKSKRLLFDPIVTIRYLNFHVTVLGEVGRPGMVMAPGEQVDILEAIGLAGDLTIYGKRENVLLLRKEKGRKIVRRLDLTSSAILSSPYYYLKNNDVIYVEPNKNKIASTSQSRQLWPAVISGFSVLAIVIDRIVK
jgi:polysaccharide export outer membrane protein